MVVIVAVVLLGLGPGGGPVMVAVTVVVTVASDALKVSSSLPHPCKESEAMKPKQTATKARASCMITTTQMVERCRKILRYNLGLFSLQPKTAAAKQTLDKEIANICLKYEISTSHVTLPEPPRVKILMTHQFHSMKGRQSFWLKSTGHLACACEKRSSSPYIISIVY